MREFKSDGKINFVDENDVLVGFDTHSSCCERFGWFYSETIPTLLDMDHLDKSWDYDKNGPQNVPDDLEKYNFDLNFFQGIGLEDSGYEYDHAAIFKLVKSPQAHEKDEKAIYLCLYNSHNGYYSHGFEAEVRGKVIRTGQV